MPDIKILSEHLINQIAAGEVVERPASVIKELVENSLDAGAKKITIEVNGGGDTFLRVTDDGYGMDKRDAQMAFERHATSKISTTDDLFKIQTLGFRGEAIASIASVAQVVLQTKKRGDLSGTFVLAEGGELKKVRDIGVPEGTQMEVKNLFYNTPVRKKYLKNEATEYGHILNTVTGVALAFPDVAFKLIHNEKVVFELPRTDEHLSRIQALIGRDTADELIPVFFGHAQIQLTGYIGKPSIARAGRNGQYLFVNKREVKSHVLSYAVKQSFYSLLPKEKSPVFLLFFQIDPDIVDVNVHPRKLEVRFADEKSIFKIVLHACQVALEKHVLAPKIGGTPPSAEPQELLSYEHQHSKVKPLTIEDKERLGWTSMPIPENPQVLSFHEKPIVESSRDTLLNEKFDAENPRDTLLSEKPNAETLRASLLNEKPAAQKAFDTREEQEEIVPLSQLANSYILCQQGEKLLIVDQHAAHERIRYTEIVEQFEALQKSVQPLLVPLQMMLSHREVEVLQENQELLKNLGFEIEEFGGNTFSLYSVPTFLTKDDPQKALVGLIDDINQNGQNAAMKGDFQMRKERILTYMACRSAVKFGDPLSTEEQRALLKKLQTLALPYTCPHGRPTMITLSFEELKRRFGRMYKA